MPAPDDALRGTGGMPRDVSFLIAASAILAALGWLLFGLSYRQTHVIQALGIFPGDAVFLDLTVYLRRWETVHTAAFFQPSPVRSTFAYPPAAALCYAVLYGTHHIKFAYTALTGAWWVTLLGGAAVELWAETRSASASVLVIGSLVLLSFPAVFLLERANIELFVWMFLLAGGVLYRKGHLHGAAASFGVATAIKLYPVLLFGLFLSRRREWRALITGALSAIAVTAISLWYMGPSFSVAAKGFLSGFRSFQGSYSKGGWFGLLGFDHSLFSPLKLWALSVDRSPQALNGPYYLIAALVSATVFVVWVRRRSMENRLAFLSVLVVMLPAVSFEYTLVQLFFPAFLLLSLLLAPGAMAGARRRSALLAFGGILFLLLPIDLLGTPAFFHAGQWQVLGLLLVAWQASRTDWRVAEALPARPL